MSSSVCRRLHGLFTTAKTTATSYPNTAKSTSTTTSGTTAPLDASDHTFKDQTIRNLVTKFKKASDSNRFRQNGQKAYGNTVRRLAAAKKFSFIEEILEHQKQYPDITNEGFTVRLISLYGKSGMFDHARNLFDEMPHLKCERTVMSFNALLSACVNSKKFNKIADLLGELPERLSIKPDRVSYNTVIKAFCEMGMFDPALSTINEMENCGVEPDLITFNTLLDALYRNDRSSDAEKLWGLMADKNIAPNVRSYNPKIRALVASNRLSEAVQVFQEMGSKEVTPDVFSFNALIKGFCNAGNWEEAKRWYKGMARADCKPDRVTFRILSYLACDKGDFDFGLELCKEAISQRCFELRVIQLVLDGLVKSSKMEEAKELVELGKSNTIFPYTLELPSHE